MNYKNTKVRIVLSIDSKNTYLTFNDTTWDNIQENNVINIGNAINEINNLTYQDFFFLNLTNKILDFMIYMEIYDITITLNIKKYSHISK